jgi:hypothetical protein
MRRRSLQQKSFWIALLVILAGVSLPSTTFAQTYALNLAWDPVTNTEGRSLQGVHRDVTGRARRRRAGRRNAELRIRGDTRRSVLLCRQRGEPREFRRSALGGNCRLHSHPVSSQPIA